MDSEHVLKESKEIFKILNQKFSQKIDGKDAIFEMKTGGYSNWKQMEWPGWYFEDIGRTILINEIGGQKGPMYGRTQFDYMNKYVWDLKIHAINNKQGNRKSWLILNDIDAIQNVINNQGGIGFIIPSAFMTYDVDGEFKKWHDALKGGKSKYELNRIKRGAYSRIRKTSFLIQSWLFLFFYDFSSILEGIHNGWAGGFQKGMRNANGSIRREKVKINIDCIPKKHILFRA